MKFLSFLEQLAVEEFIIIFAKERPINKFKTITGLFRTSSSYDFKLSADSQTESQIESTGETTRETCPERLTSELVVDASRT